MSFASSKNDKEVWKSAEDYQCIKKNKNQIKGGWETKRNPHDLVIWYGRYGETQLLFYISKSRVIGP